MNKYIVYEKAIDVIRDSTEWSENEENKVYANYILGVLEMADRIIEEIEERKINSSEI